jgi:hypothetical protein
LRCTIFYFYDLKTFRYGDAIMNLWAVLASRAATAEIISKRNALMKTPSGIAPRMAEGPPDTDRQTTEVPVLLRTTALVLRAIFLGALIVLALRVSAPQSETIWSAYETPGDLIRLVLGAAVALGILIHLFKPPRDAHALRTWAYLGLVLAPAAVAITVVMW